MSSRPFCSSSSSLGWQLAAENVSLHDRIAQLCEELGRNSENSSKPPSADRIGPRQSRADRRRCGCGTETVGVFPPEARAPVCWGPEVRAFAVYLMDRQHLPLERTAELLADLLGANVSTGWLCQVQAEAGPKLVPFVGTLKELLKDAQVVHDSATGVLTLSGDDTIANYQAALRSVEFSTTDPSASPAARVVSFQVTDSDNVTSNTESRTIDVPPAAGVSRLWL
jgi:Transposase IS66 family/Family of unknown function (DUF6444)